MLALFQLFVFIFSVIVHEVSHGLMALRLGDTTARDAGRLTLNPLVHLELFGSFILPFLLYVVSGGAFVFGWAKPVPYDPRFLRNPLRGAGLIAAAGPCSNLFIALVFGLVIRLFGPFLLGTPFADALLLFHLIVFVNVLLALFNLLPFPPLDGSKILFAFLPPRYDGVRIVLEQYGFTLLLLFVFFGFDLVQPIIELLYRLFVGVPLL